MEEKVYRTELTPVSFLERSALVFPDKVAIVHGDRQYTYREFAERAESFPDQVLGNVIRKTAPGFAPSVLHGARQARELEPVLSKAAPALLD